jgi:DNA repair exonuclease SbcCD ATPase subunit
MKDIVKSDLRENKQDVALIKQEIESNKSILEKSKKQLEDHKTNVKEKNDTKKDELEAQVKEKTTETESLKKKYQEKKKEIEKIKVELDKKKELSYKNSNAITEIDKKLKIFNENKCPHCLSDLTDDKHVNIKNKLEEKRSSFGLKKPEIKKEIDDLQSVIDTLREEQNNINNNFQKLNAEVSTLNVQILELNDSTEEDQTESLNSIVSTIENEIKELESKLIKKEKLNDIVIEMDSMLSDDGIKKALMDKIIPVLNAKILKVSKLLDFKFSFEFDNKFDPIISHLGMEISPESLSSGEKKKMNMIVLLSMLELIKMKHPQINMLFLDEVFVNLDKNNIYKVVQILRDFVTKNNMTVFVISHETLPGEFFDKKIHVKEVNGYSQMNITEITSSGKTVAKEIV